MIEHKFHHDSRPYAVANAEAAEKAKTRLKSRFASGIERLAAASKSVDESIPEDKLVPSQKLTFDCSDGSISVRLGDSDFQTVHNHAFGQLTAKAGIPMKYADLLLKENPALLVENLTSRYHMNRADKVFLARSVDNQLRGWLSNSYGRFDIKPMMESFVDTCVSYGAVPADARNMETRFFMKMLLPIIYEPVPNEVLAFGIQFRSSDFGDGAYEIRGFVSRVWCTNDAMTEDCLRQVHLGPKLTAANFSQETLSKQTEMLASATRDTVASILRPENIEYRLQAIQEADAKMIKIGDALERLKKQNELTKGETDRVVEILTTSDVEVLPPVRTTPKKGHTSLYRFANAISALANEDTTDARRAMDLEIVAGKLLRPVSKS